MTADGSMVDLREDGTWVRTFTPESASADFRGVQWGATMEEVRAKENQPPKFDDEGVIIYSQLLSEMDADAIYIFVGERLVRAKYAFLEQYTSENRYIGAFMQVKELFGAKYGQPKEDRTIWQDELFRDDPDDWGRAVERGDLAFLTTWVTPQTEISLLLHGNDYKSHLVVEYTSLKLQSWADSVTMSAQHDLI